MGENVGSFLTNAKSMLLRASLESTATYKRNKEQKVLVSQDSAVATLFHLSHRQ